MASKKSATTVKRFSRIAAVFEEARALVGFHFFQDIMNTARDNVVKGETTPILGCIGFLCVQCFSFLDVVLFASNLVGRKQGTIPTLSWIGYKRTRIEED